MSYKFCITVRSGQHVHEDRTSGDVEETMLAIELLSNPVTRGV